MKSRFFAIGLMAAALFACSRLPDTLEEIPFEPEPFPLQEPLAFGKMKIPADNPLTVDGVALGRRLFYDPVLSADSTLSCAGCHLPEQSFTDGRALSAGFRQRLGRRNAPSLANVGYYNTGFFWDGRSPSLEEQALHPVSDTTELGAGWELVEERLQQHPDYPVLFRKAFGIGKKEEINRDLVAKALAQFERTLVSGNAKYDQVQRGEATFTDSEWRGRQIFFDSAPDQLPTAECGHCHQPPFFTGQGYFNNGLDEQANLAGYPDKGRGAVTGDHFDFGKFRTPSLRNVALTAPYMHDGRFATLEQVVDHYASGGHLADNVSPNVRPLRLNGQDKADLVAFLKTLTDREFLQNPGLTNPFARPEGKTGNPSLSSLR